MNPITRFFSTQTDNNRRSSRHYIKRSDERGWYPEALAIVWDIPLRLLEQFRPVFLSREDYWFVTGNVSNPEIDDDSGLPVYSMCVVIEFKRYDDAMMYKLRKTHSYTVSIVDGREESS